MNWWHTIEMPDGEVTPGRLDYRGPLGERFLLPADLTGKRVLDLGTYDGFWAIEAKRRGAAFVVAADRWWPMLETAKKSLGAYDIEYMWSGDLDLPLRWQSYADSFDVVLFYGILYHLKNPYQGLKNAVDCCKPGGIVIVESAVNEGKMRHQLTDVPLLWVIDRVHHDDPTNYFMPNLAGVHQLCIMAGLEPTATVALESTRYTLVCRKPE